MEIGILKDDLTALPFNCAGVHFDLIDFTVLSASLLKSELVPDIFILEILPSVSTTNVMTPETTAPS